ncbi:MAG: adenosine deaminase [Bacteroidia bacterium]|nr:adenosine deaminase [Bacteroidia bacterium]
MALRNKLHSLPKADVHNHLHLSGAVELLREQYPGVQFETPRYYDGFDGMMHFIVQHVNTLMRSSDDVIRLMDIGIRSSINDNVRHLEASVDMGLVAYFDNSLETFINAVGQLKKKYASEIDFRPEIGIKKSAEMEEVYRDGMACIESEVFDGIDIYGKETDQDLSGFKEIFQEARARSKKTKVHIGEFSDAQSMLRAIETLEPDEIQHGINAADSEKAIQMILDRNIRLNICPHSNVALGAARSLLEHPVRKLYEEGVNITINTDDLLLFNATITDQFADLIQQRMFTFEEIDEIRQNAIQGL